MDASSLARHRAEDYPRWVREVVADAWNVVGETRLLPGDRDLNLLLASGRDRWVVKVAPPGEDADALEAQALAATRVADGDPTIRVPRPVPAGDGGLVVAAKDPEGGARLVRLLTWVPGTPLAEVRPWSSSLLEGVGALLGRVDRALSGFDHPGARRAIDWDLVRGPQVVEGALHLHDDRDRRRVEGVLAGYRERAAPLAKDLPRTVIHGDGNEHNVLVGPVPEDPLDPRRVTGLVDFGDLVHSWRVAEVAVAGAYAMMGRRDPVDALARVVAGYHREMPLGEAEIEAVYPLALLRVAVSVSVSARRRSRGSASAYHLVSESPAWDLLHRLEGQSPDLAHYVLRSACGLEPCPNGGRVARWLAAHPGDAGPVLDPDPGAVPRTTFDLSVGSLELEGLGGRDDDPAAWTRVLFRRMEDEGARVGVGRWDEARRWYTSEAYAAASDDGPVRRTVHVGVDLFVEPGTPVLAALDGTVAAVVDNDRPLDYGPTVTLRHEPEPGLVFHTLHGHLDRATLEALEPGRAVRRGDVVGRVGDVHENGGWAPHLHLQVVADPLGDPGDVPGVCRPDLRDVWTSICPDPNLLLGLPEGVAAPRPPDEERLRARRTCVLGPNLSLSYRTPIHVVRGWMQRLYDVDGRPFLDCVNNVAHVGHAHPRVAAALGRQAATLNTNTRYLHREILDYAERLASLLPDPLGVVWLVCSGSEANELALRLARAHTDRRDVVVLDGAYHGNSGALVDMSPYKFGGGGGRGRPAWVHVAAMPDPYRGAHRGPDAGGAYAADVARALADAAGRTDGAPSHEGRPLAPGAAAFFAEPILSCGGQVEPPPGYLAAAFRAARDAGAVCVADEVQAGLGRVGSHWWAFQTQDAVPDIVTLGKPLGNGHPHAAVVTTPEIAASFDTGMEYFNTFGGNPVSCAVGSAVLDVIEDEGLRERARDVGAYLEEGLRDLMDRHPLVGDVRGRGMFLGVELVADRERRTPAPRQARYVVERARELGVLLSTDGPDHDVVKIKPPLQFDRDDADLLVGTLDRVLAEDPARPA